MEWYIWTIVALAYLATGIFWLKFKIWRPFCWAHGKLLQDSVLKREQGGKRYYFSNYWDYYTSSMCNETACFQLLGWPLILIGQIISLVFRSPYYGLGKAVEFIGIFAKRITGLNGAIQTTNT